LRVFLGRSELSVRNIWAECLALLKPTAA